MPVEVVRRPSRGEGRVPEGGEGWILGLEFGASGLESGGSFGDGNVPDCWGLRPMPMLRLRKAIVSADDWLARCKRVPASASSVCR